MKPICYFPVNSYVIIKKNFTKYPLKRRILSLGLLEDSVIKVIRKGRQNSLTVYLIKGIMIALRDEECIDILAEEVN